MRTFEFVTREFTEKFSKNNENRVVNHAHLKKIKEQMKTSFYTIPPPTINKITFNIIDGQHRIKAFQELVDEGIIDATLQIPVMYVSIGKEVEREAIVNANTNSKNWSLDDYIASYTKSNSESSVEYKKLKDWCNSHPLCNDGKKSKYRYGAAMLKGIGCSKSLKDGSFSIAAEDLIRGEQIHDEILEIVGVLGFPLKGNYFEYLAISWAQVRELHSFKEWFKEIKSKKATLSKKPYANKSDWDSIFSNIHRSIDLKK